MYICTRTHCICTKTLHMTYNIENPRPDLEHATVPSKLASPVKKSPQARLFRVENTLPFQRSVLWLVYIVP